MRAAVWKVVFALAAFVWVGGEGFVFTPVRAQEGPRTVKPPSKFEKTDARLVFWSLAKQKKISCIIQNDVKGVISGEAFDADSSDVFIKLAEAADCKVYATKEFCLVYSKGWSPSDAFKKEIDALGTAVEHKEEKKFQMLSFENADLALVLEAMAKRAGMKLSCPPHCTGTVTARLVNMPLAVAIRLIVLSKGGSLIEKDGAWEVVLPEPKTDPTYGELLRKAEAGDTEAQFALGKYCQEVVRDYATARKWCRMAAEKGHVEAQFELAEALIRCGVSPSKKEQDEAFQCLQKAVTKGHVRAMNQLGFCYMNAYGVAKDQAVASRWFLKAAEQGEPFSQYYLGRRCQVGIGNVQDEEEAVRWFRKAAEQDVMVAQEELGSRYATGTGLKQDLKEAAHWLQKSAERGYYKAQDELGLLYFEGKGVPQNYADAYFWMSLAFKVTGNGQLEKIAGKMTPEQIEEGKRRVAEFKPTPARQWYDSPGSENLTGPGRSFGTAGSAFGTAGLAVGYVIRGSITGAGIERLDNHSPEEFKKSVATSGLRAYGGERFFLVYGKDWEPSDALKKEVDALNKNGELKGDFGDTLTGWNWGILDYVAREDLKLKFPLDLKGRCSANVSENNMPPLSFVRIILGTMDYSLVEHDGVSEVVVPEPLRDKTYRELLPKAEAGDVEAQYLLGRWCYETGWGGEPTRKAALDWWRKAAEKGYAPAQALLGRYLAWNAKTSNEGFGWLHKAEVQGDRSAMYCLGYFLQNGYGITKNEAEAFKWYVKAADKGHAIAQYLVGYMYQEGQVTAKDDAKAVEYLRKSAEQNCGAAVRLLAKKYAEGKGVKQDFKESARWLRGVAEWGDCRAQHDLGFMYFEGKGVPLDLVEAYRWVSLASTQVEGDDEFAADVRKVAEKMSPEQIEKGRRLSAEFKPKVCRSRDAWEASENVE